MANSEISIRTVSTQSDPALYRIEKNIGGDKWTPTFHTDFPDFSESGVFVTRELVDVAFELATERDPDRNFRIVSYEDVKMRRDNALAQLLALADERVREEVKQLAEAYSRLSEQLSPRHFGNCCFETE